MGYVLPSNVVFSSDGAHLKVLGSNPARFDPRRIEQIFRPNELGQDMAEVKAPEHLISSSFQEMLALTKSRIFF